MLNNVPQSIRRLARQTVLNHPNAYNIQYFRRVVNRVSSDGDAMGMPTWGGAGVLDSTDEEDISYEWVGNGYALSSDAFQPASAMERQDANVGQVEMRFIIEPEANDSNEVGWFDPKTKDVFYVLIGIGVYSEPAKLAFEVATIETIVNIPPFVNRVVVNRRDDLHVQAEV